MTTRPHPESERPLHGALQSFNLSAEVTRLREEKAWQEGRRNAITLHKGEGLNVVLLVMKEGDRLDEHSAPGPRTLRPKPGRCSRATLECATRWRPSVTPSVS